MDEKKILVVDDEEKIREMYSQVFSSSGYLVTTAKSAEDAIKILENERYWVMFLDLNLPEMNGIDLCRQIRRDYPMTICYAVTGYASLFELHDCREAGFEDYFTKPASLSDLLDAAAHAFTKIERWKKR